MKSTLLLFLFAAICWAQPTVNNCRVPSGSITHSAAQVVCNGSARPNKIQIQYAENPTTCDGVGNMVQYSGVPVSVLQQYAQAIDTSGLKPAQIYNTCMQFSTDSGATWSPLVTTSFTTLAAPTPDPALPVAPTTFSTAYPNFSGATVVNASSNCSTLQGLMDTATAALGSNSTVINVPIGADCQGQYTSARAADSKVFTMTYDGTVTLTAHGFSNGQQVRLGTTVALPGADAPPFGLTPPQTGGFQDGTIYYVINSTTNTFQLSTTNGGAVKLPGYIGSGYAGNVSCDTGTSSIKILPDIGYGNGVKITTNQEMEFITGGSLCTGLSAVTKYYALAACSSANAPCEFQVSLTVGGAAVTLSSVGSGVITILTPGSGTQYLIPWPPVASNWVQIRSAAADSVLPPVGTRATPTYQPQMATFRRSASGASATDISFGFGILSHNIWFGPGLEFTQVDTGTAEVMVNNDPTPYLGWLQTNRDTGNIIFDRDYIHALPAPNRLLRGFVTWDGSNIALMNSDLRNFNFFHTWYQGFVPTVNSNVQMTLTSGLAHLANGTVPTTSTSTVINMTGGVANGTGYIYIDLSQVLNVVMPLGMTATCTVTGLTCTVSTSASPGFPTTGFSQSTVEKLATFTIITGHIGTSSQADGTSSHFAVEGCQCIIAGNGPGPWITNNNYISGSGLVFHHDDSGGVYLDRADSTMDRNTWVIPAFTMQGGSMSDGFDYEHRQILESKGTRRWAITGSTFTGQYREVNPNGITIAITPRNGGYVSDVLIKNNTINTTSAGVQLGGPVDAASPQSFPAERFQYLNNLMYDILGYQQFASPYTSAAGGWQWYGGYAMDDVTRNHNTVYNPRGTFIESWHQQVSPIEGVVDTNNFLWIDSRMGYVSENVAAHGYPSATCSGVGPALLGCMMTKGIGVSSYTNAGNVAIPTWTNTQFQTGQTSPATICANFGGAFSGGLCTGSMFLDLRSDVDVPTSIAAVKWTNPAAGDFSLLVSSPYHNAATDSTDVGVNMITLNNAQGVVSTPNVTSITNSGGTVNFVNADTFGCPVDASLTSGFTSFTRFANAGGTTSQSVALTGLASSTLYYARVNCEVNQPVVTFTTTGGGGGSGTGARVTSGQSVPSGRSTQ